MLKIKEAIIVEGKYDKIRLSSIVDTVIIETNGFRIFSDKEKQKLIRKIAEVRGILVLTDSDGAGFVIRNFLKGSIQTDKVKHCYIPQIKGKEKRKAQHSKEGFFGVEGIDNSILLDAIKKSGATILSDYGENTENKNEESGCENENHKKPDGEIKSYGNDKNRELTKADLFSLGLTGTKNAESNRKSLLKYLDMPTYLSTNAMLTVLNCLYSPEEVYGILQDLLY